MIKSELYDLIREVHMIYYTILTGGRITKVKKCKNNKYLVFSLPGLNGRRRFQSMILLEPVELVDTENKI